MPRVAAIALMFVAVVLLPGQAGAGDADTVLVRPTQTCLGIDHFPEVPVNGGPTKAVFGLIADPELRADMLTILLSGASGDQMGSGTVDPDGIGFAEVGIFSYGEHVITEAYLTTPDGDLPVDPTSFSSESRFIVDAEEPLCDTDVLGPPIVTPTATTPTTAPETTTTSTTTTSTTAPIPETTLPETTAPETTVPASSTVSTDPPTTGGPAGGSDDGGTGGGDSGGGGWLPGLLIGGGIVVLIAGGIVLAKGSKNCDREREELASARRQLEAINETLNEALADYYESSAELDALQDELAALEAAVDRGGSSVGSTEYFVVDHERLTAAEVRAERDFLRSMIDIVRSTAAADEVRVKEWSDRFDAGAEKVRAASAALDTCEGRGAPSTPSGPSAPSGPAAPGTPGPGPAGPGVVSPPGDSSTPDVCEPGTERRVAGRPERMQQVVDFAVIVQVMEGSKRKVGEANQLQWDLARLGSDIDALGKALGAGGAAKSAVGGLRGIGNGSYVMGAGGLVKGTAEGTMASGVTDVDIPLSAHEAVVEALEGLAKMSSMIAGAVGGWMKMNQLYQVRLTMFCQTIVATPYEISTCVDGQWQCKKIWQYDVGPLAKFGRPNKHLFTLNSTQELRRMRGQIRRSAVVAEGQLSKGLTARAAFDARHQPGACR